MQLNTLLLILVKAILVSQVIITWGMTATSTAKWINMSAVPKVNTESGYQVRCYYNFQQCFVRCSNDNYS